MTSRSAATVPIAGHRPGRDRQGRGGRHGMRPRTHRPAWAGPSRPSRPDPARPSRCRRGAQARPLDGVQPGKAARPARLRRRSDGPRACSRGLVAGGPTPSIAARKAAYHERRCGWRYARRLPGGRFAGITTFPTQLYRPCHGTVKSTQKPSQPCAGPPRRWPRPVARTSRSTRPHHVSEILARWPRPVPRRSSPATASPVPRPLHAIPRPAGTAGGCLSQRGLASHRREAFCFAAGPLYRSGVPDYQVRAIVARERRGRCGARPGRYPVPAMIDYYGMIDASGPAKPRVGDSVVFGFRPAGLRHARLCRRVSGWPAAILSSSRFHTPWAASPIGPCENGHGNEPGAAPILLPARNLGGVDSRSN